MKSVKPPSLRKASPGQDPRKRMGFFLVKLILALGFFQRPEASREKRRFYSGVNGRGKKEKSLLCYISEETRVGR